MDDAEIAIVILSSAAGTVKTVVDAMRAKRRKGRFAKAEDIQAFSIC